MRHLEQIGGDRHSGGQEVALDFGLDVAGQENGAPAVRHPQDERLVVGSQPPAWGAAGVRDIEASAAKVDAHAAARPQDDDAEMGGGRFETAYGGVVGGQGSEPERRRPELRQDRGGAADVIAVRVGHRHDVEPQQPHGTQGRRDHPRPDVELHAPQPAGIDQHRRARRRAHEDRVPLADIDRHDLHPTGGGAPAARRVEAPARQETRGQQERHRCRGAPRPHAGRAARRRHGGEQGDDKGPRGRDDPQAACRQAGAGGGGAVNRLEQDARERDRVCRDLRQRRRRGQRDETEQQAGRRRRHRHQVGRQSGRADAVKVARRQRRGRDKRREAGPRHAGDETPSCAGQGAPAPRGGGSGTTTAPAGRREQAERRRVAQLEPRLREPGRTVRQEEKRRDGDRPRGAGPSSGQKTEAVHQHHERGAGDRPAGSGQAAIQGDDAEQGQPPRPGPAGQQRQERRRARRHAGDIESGQCHDVVDTGRLQSLFQVGGEILAFADQKRGQEGGRIRP